MRLSRPSSLGGEFRRSQPFWPRARERLPPYRRKLPRPGSSRRAAMALRSALVAQLLGVWAGLVGAEPCHDSPKARGVQALRPLGGRSSSAHSGGGRLAERRRAGGSRRVGRLVPIHRPIRSRRGRLVDRPVTGHSGPPSGPPTIHHSPTDRTTIDPRKADVWPADRKPDQSTLRLYLSLGGRPIGRPVSQSLVVAV